MPSTTTTVDLKPQIPVDVFTKSVIELYMTQHRSVVPRILKDAGVTAPQWEQTYEDLIQLYDNFLRLIAKAKKRRILSRKGRSEKVSEVCEDHYRVWQEMIAKQAAIYEPLGVKVTMANQAVSYRTGSDLNMRVEPVGLRFHVSTRRSLASSYGTASTISSRFASGSINPKSTPSTSIYEKLRQAQM
mmetsp:Transcript_5303/g.10912  ORF Transcript_5303/g.10912 Transcript_5303/m.10912 type:complete len:187 (-) Transcript_5303:96-656(-)